ncbi:PREDICTED: glutathione S-transferase T3-like [Camelina sativa]|uniref:Glutathione S-transferase T3-like n=1 Tax=Camelina sativa TaxID=90675 RepID=A0ABM0TCY9_CAMSA|nr:PREDICTED: glutathione S-transferase T3-like [Camelina sativa]
MPLQMQRSLSRLNRMVGGCGSGGRYLRICGFFAASPVGNRRAKHAWLPADDVMLVRVWLNTSKDPSTSNEQRRRAFWGRIADYVSKCPNAVGRPKRESSHCKQRWGKINDTVCKFVGCYETAIREKSSGHNEDDVMKLAHQIFFNDQNVKFALEHAWRELRYDQKWCASTSSKGNGVKRTRVCEDGSAHPSTSEAPIDVEDEPMHRPTSVKAAKVLRGKAKKNINTKVDVEGDAKALLEFQMQEVGRMYEMKQKDFALKRDGVHYERKTLL